MVLAVPPGPGPLARDPGVPLEIAIDRCKGCELCITACPPRVLTMSTDVNHLGYHVPQLHPGCTGCAACLFVCPDFCFEVFRYDEPVVTEVTT